MANQAFEALRGNGIIGSSSTTDTLTESTDYTLPVGADSTNCFVRLANTRHASIGRNDAGTDHPMEAFGVHVSNPANIATSLNFVRGGTPAYNADYRYEILCYTGGSGGANEFVVRDVGTVTGTSQTLTGSTITTISNEADCVVFITGVSSTNTGSTDWHEMLFTADLVANASNWDPQFTRGTSATASGTTISYAVVEFTGSNWSVDRFETSSYSGTAWGLTGNQSGTIAHGITIADIDKAGIIECQTATDDDPTATLHAGDAVMLEDATNIRVWRRSSGNVHTICVYVLQNSQASGSARNFNVQHFEYKDESLNVSDPREISVDIDVDPDVTVGTISNVTAPLAETSLVASSSCGDTGTYYPRGGFNYWITDAGTVTYEMSNDDVARAIAFELFEWPEDVGSPTIIEVPTGPLR